MRTLTTSLDWSQIMAVRPKIKAYYQLTKPGIIYGNLLSTFAGFFLASKGDIHLGTLIAVSLGTALGIASGCVFNNYIDRDIDKKMERTKKRALVTGTISGRGALIYATILGALSFSILALGTNLLVVLAGFVGVLFYIVLYAIAKRKSSLGTVVGSIPGAIPPIAGYLAVSDSFDMGALLLFLIMVVWQMPHFYAISIFRLKDYAAAGLPVLSVTRGIKTAKMYIMLYILAYIAIAPLLTILGYTGYTYLVLIGIIGLYWFWRGLDGYNKGNEVAWARKMFGVSLLVLLTSSVVMSLDAWLP